MKITEEQHLAHYGILRRSGRYPWGSGGTQSVRNRTFLDIVEEHKREGMTDPEIARAYDMTTTQLRASKTIALAEQKQVKINQAQRLKDKGLSNVEIGKKMGLNESSVRALLAPGAKDRAENLTATARMLKTHVEDKKFLDIGSGAEQSLNVSATKLNAAVAMLKEEGYEVHDVNIPQVGTGNFTKYKVLCPPGTTRKEAFAHRYEIQQINAYSDDGGRSYLGVLPPLSINAKRVGIRYAEDGGTEADGVIFVRPGVKDVSLGGSHYAQVRIQVGDKHYLKGMAIYKDDLPDGIDLQFNTNKTNTGNKFDAMKKLKLDKLTGEVDKDNPFGSSIKAGGQLVKKDSKGNVKVTSVMNKLSEEGDWVPWSAGLSSQMLSKQSTNLAREQLNKTYESRLKEYERISNLTNPAVRKKLLEDFGDETSKAAVHMQAAKLSARQASHVILPLATMKPTEVYAPNFSNGERVVLIRHPHAGTFEIPELTVNNTNREGRKLLGDVRDAIGIHHTVAEHLSGADFDGDTVLVIPNNNGKVQARPALDSLKGFDPKREYPKYEGMKPMTAKQKGQEMGKISNLITDMTIKGAPVSEITRAVKHSMVVIDAEKHELDYKSSAKQNGIAQLTKKYQAKDDPSKPSGGAATLISRASSKVYVPDRTPRSAAQGGPIDKSTGERVFVPTNKMKPGKDGVEVPVVKPSKKLSETNDAHTLSSGRPMEKIYADHSNRMKELGNKARLESVHTKPSVYSPSANKAYASEVKSLNAKLALVVSNRPRERQAQVVANSTIALKKHANPNMDEETLKKVKNQALTEARRRTGAQGEKVVITQSEWDAIQAGAVTNSKLNQILAKADMTVVRQLATPKRDRLMTDANTARAKRLLASGLSRAEVAEKLGVSLTTLDEATVE